MSGRQALMLRLGQAVLLGVASGVVVEVARLTERVIQYGIGMTPQGLFLGLVYLFIGAIYCAVTLLIARVLLELLIGVLGAWNRVGALIRGMRSSRGRNSSSS